MAWVPGRVVNDQAPIRLLVAAGGAMVMVGGAGRLVLRTYSLVAGALTLPAASVAVTVNV